VLATQTPTDFTPLIDADCSSVAIQLMSALATQLDHPLGRILKAAQAGKRLPPSWATTTATCGNPFL
jgi:hypothetical protein